MKRVLVVGDAIADVYRDCSFKKMCPDAPDAQALIVRSSDLRPGGAANVALNLVALSPDTRVSLIAEVDTEMGQSLKRLSRNRLDLEYIVLTDDMLTKERILLDGKVLLRKDNRENVGTFTAELIEDRVREYLAENDPDLIIVSDYAQGSLNEASWDMLLACRDRLLVDTKLTDLSFFCDEGWRTRLVKLNWDEHAEVLKKEYAPERFFRTLIVTCGGDGSYMKIRERIGDKKSITHMLRVNAHKVDVVDVCGCGDTVMAGLAASLLKNDDDFTAMQFANAAAATVVTKARTSVADLGETLRLLGWEEEDETR